jgi:hypothetical protein
LIRVSDVRVNLYSTPQRKKLATRRPCRCESPHPRTGLVGGHRTQRSLRRARREPARAGRSASQQAGPRLLTLGQLERVRDDLADRIAALRDRRGHALLEAMHAHPERHRGAVVTSADLGEPGCTVWRVRPRLGLIGMLMGWWRVKVSSGCPLAG